MPAPRDTSQLPTDLLLTVTMSDVGTDIILCVVVGEIDMDTAPRLQSKLTEVLTRTRSHLVIDLSDVRFLGSAGLQVLCEVHTAQQTVDRHLAVVTNDDDIVARPLRLTTFDQILDIHRVVNSRRSMPRINKNSTRATKWLRPRPMHATENMDTQALTLIAVWCSSVGSTWTIEIHELNPNATLGPLVSWISSGVHTSQPMPDETLARELLADRYLYFYPHFSIRPRTSTRHSIGYVTNKPNDYLEVLESENPTPTTGVQSVSRAQEHAGDLLAEG